MGKPIMKVWDETQQKYVSVPAVKGLPGAAGTTPHIGANGNWYLGETDTGAKATGPAGTPGKNGSDASVTSANIANALGYTPRKAWYVNITGTPDAPTGDKTPAEIYQAYTDGYAVYAVVQMTDLYSGVPFALPLVAILPFSGSYLACFSTLAEPHFDGAAGIMEITATWNQRWYLFTSAIASKNDIPTVPTALKNPNALTFTGAASGSYDGSAAKTVNIPTVPTELKNPNALTIKIGSTTVTYDGSSAQTVEIADGTEVSY